MFTTVPADKAAVIDVEIEGKRVAVPENISVAAAMLGYGGKTSCRTSFIRGEKRAPFCFMGVCHECLVEINGKPNQQACLTTVQEGMLIKAQHVREGEK